MQSTPELDQVSEVKMRVSLFHTVFLVISAALNIVLLAALLKYRRRHAKLDAIVEKFRDLARRLRDIVVQREESFYKNLLQVSKSFVEPASGTFLIYFKGEHGKVVAPGDASDAKVSELTVKKTELPLRSERVYTLESEELRKLLVSLTGGESTVEAQNGLVADVTLGGELKAKLVVSREKPFTSEEMELLRTLSSFLSSFIATHNYISNQGRFQKDMVLTLIRILEYHDRYTKGHSKSVATISSLIAERLGLNDEYIKKTYWAALLHDVGKIVVPSHILNKEGKLTVEEFELVRKHPVYGHDFLITSTELNELAKYVLHHHERWDGRGYPSGIPQDEIPIVSRIISIADAIDAMKSDRPYRRGLPTEVVRAELVKHSGQQFDPELVRVVVEMIDRGEIN